MGGPGRGGVSLHANTKKPEEYKHLCQQSDSTASQRFQNLWYLVLVFVSKALCYLPRLVKRPHRSQATRKYTAAFVQRWLPKAHFRSFMRVVERNHTHRRAERRNAQGTRDQLYRMYRAAALRILVLGREKERRSPRKIAGTTPRVRRGKAVILVARKRHRARVMQIGEEISELDQVRLPWL